VPAISGMLAAVQRATAPERSITTFRGSSPA
jgi:hypothetical protein